MAFLTILIRWSAVILMVSIMVEFGKSEETDDSLLVNTTVGLIRGLRAIDGSAMFLGIPYAVVDGKNPFGVANPNPVFDDVFNAFNDSKMCPQGDSLQEMTLDCLHLNIHVPKTAVNNPLPVFVYIHGGGFYTGSSSKSSLDPKYLIRHDVIFVSFNYRLAAYGFMCLRTPEVPGNQGLKDQLYALRWIKNNIKAFGGDPESITIAGDSAGAISVQLQLLFAEEGLFHKAIALSGSALSPMAFREPDLNAAVTIANYLGLETNNTNDAITFLSTQTPNKVLLAANDLQIIFIPCIEKDLPNVEIFVATNPVNAKFTQAKNIPIICGHTDDEWLIMYLNLPAEIFETLDVFNNNMNNGFEFGAIHDAMKSFVQRFYVGDEPMSVKLRRPVTEFDSDFFVAHPTQRLLRKYLNEGGVAYHYVFSYVGGRNVQRIRFNITEGGAAHSDDLGYIFDLPELVETSTPDDWLMIGNITTLWTNFAKYGNPTPSITELLPILWLPISEDRHSYLNLNNPLELRTRPFHQRLSFWDYFYEINKDYIRDYSIDTVMD